MYYILFGYPDPCKNKKNTISINGICLKIEYYCPEELKISGNILYINYE